MNRILKALLKTIAFLVSCIIIIFLLNLLPEIMLIIIFIVGIIALFFSNYKEE